MKDNEPGGGISRRNLIKGMMAILAAPVISNNADAESPERATSGLIDLVNPMQGTNSNFGFSVGNTLPLVTRPFGMAHWAPQTKIGDGWFFDPNAHKLQGIRATHQPSPWMGDYGNFTIMAQSGPAIYHPDERAAPYTDSQFVVHPNYLSFDLTSKNIRIEAAPTERCAVFRFTFPQGQPARVIIDTLSTVWIDPNRRVITGSSKHNSGGVPANFANYLYAEFETPYDSAVPLIDFKPLTGQDHAETGNVGIAIEFVGASSLIMRIATSFISSDQARKNLAREVGMKTFDEIKKDGASAWDRALGNVQVEGGSIEQKRTFYSCLYRTQLFPRPIYEYDDTGQPIHYSPYDGAVHAGPLYADTGLWDGYHTLYPLLSIIATDRLSDIIAGFLNAYRESGWLPQWPSPGSRGTMGGTHSDSLIAEAITKGLTGFDRELAYAAALKDATVANGGRSEAAFYVANGYAPGSVSETLDYAYDDHCIALAALSLGHNADAEMLQKRALNYRTIYDPSVGFMRARNRDGSWLANFDQFYWGGPYTEGGPWQWSFSAPHDPAGLMTLMGGQTEFLAKLDKMLLQPPIFHTGGYGGVIHEMKEMAAVQFGQYAQSNQPVHQYLYLFTAAGCPWKTQYWARRVMDKLYSPDVFPGDEDNGEMAAWYVLNAIGLFPSCPGHPSLTFGSPLFEKIKLNLKGGKQLTIDTAGNEPHNVYVNRVKLNGHDYSPTWISYVDLMKGGTLQFEMASSPIGRDLETIDLPYSLTPYTDLQNGPAIWSTRVAINCGGDALEDYVGDCFVSKLGNEKVATAKETSPLSIWSTSRSGQFRYDIPLPMLPNNRSYSVSLFTRTTSGENALILNGDSTLASTDQPSGASAQIERQYNHVYPEVDACITVEGTSDESTVYGIRIFSN